MPAHADPIDVYVGSRVKKYRLLLRVSQEELAEAIGVTFQQVQKYESGHNRISASRLYDIATFLGRRVQDFYTGIEKEVPKSRLAAVGVVTDPPNHMQLSETLTLVRNYYKLDGPVRAAVHDLIKKFLSRL